MRRDRPPDTGSTKRPGCNPRAAPSGDPEGTAWSRSGHIPQPLGDLARIRGATQCGDTLADMASILVVEDEALLARQIARALTSSDHTVRVADCCEGGLALVDDAMPDVLVLDLRLPDGSGLDLMARGPGTRRDRAGDPDDRLRVGERRGRGDAPRGERLHPEAARPRRAAAGGRADAGDACARAGARLSPTPRGHASRHEIVGDDPRLAEIFEQAERLASAGLAPAERPAILISGETGTGKGMLARAIHGILGGGPFIAANCTALPESLIEAELFGHERGSFTDAKAARSGLFEAADGGTIFLDEVGHASPELQAKLLKVLEEKQVRRIGSSRDREVDVPRDRRDQPRPRRSRRGR